MKKIAIAAIALICLAVFAWTGYQQHLIKSSEAWRSVSGQVKFKMYSRKSHLFGPKPHQLFVRYEFEVDGKKYEGTRGRCGPGALYYKDGEALFGKGYQPPVRVFYDPDDPSRSCLIPGGRVPIAPVAAAGGVFTVLVLGTMLVQLIARRP